MHPVFVDMIFGGVGLEEEFAGDVHLVLDRQRHHNGVGSQWPVTKIFNKIIQLSWKMIFLVFAMKINNKNKIFFFLYDNFFGYHGWTLKSVDKRARTSLFYCNTLTRLVTMARKTIGRNHGRVPIEM